MTGSMMRRTSAFERFCDAPGLSDWATVICAMAEDGIANYMVKSLSCNNSCFAF